MKFIFVPSILRKKKTKELSDFTEPKQLRKALPIQSLIIVEKYSETSDQMQKKKRDAQRIKFILN